MSRGLFRERCFRRRPAAGWQINHRLAVLAVAGVLVLVGCASSTTPVAAAHADTLTVMPTTHSPLRVPPTTIKPHPKPTSGQPKPKPTTVARRPSRRPYSPPPVHGPGQQRPSQTVQRPVQQPAPTRQRWTPAPQPQSEAQHQYGWGCGTALAYLSTHAAPGFRLVCYPGSAHGAQAMTCVNHPPQCGSNDKAIFISNACPVAYKNEAANSWIASRLRTGRYDPYGLSC
jgi:hypothetical protein